MLDIDSSPLSPSHPRVRYRAICQAGILAAAICGIDLTDACNPDAEITLERKDKKDSVGSRETVSLSNTPIGYRRKNQNGAGHRSHSEIGAYRRRGDDDFDYDMINNSSSSSSNIANNVVTKRFELSSTPDISSSVASKATNVTLMSHNSLPYNEQDTIHIREDMYIQPSVNAAVARFRRESSENHPGDVRQQSKSASPIRRTAATSASSEHFDSSKPQRPKTLNVQSTVPAFTNSNTSSSSQSPASTPGSPKPIGKVVPIMSADRIDKVSSMPTRIHQYTGTNSSTRPRAQSAFNQPGIVRTQQQQQQQQSNIPQQKTEEQIIAFI